MSLTSSPADLEQGEAAVEAAVELATPESQPRSLTQERQARLEQRLEVLLQLMDEARPLGQYGVDDHAEIFVVRRLASSRPPRS